MIKGYCRTNLDQARNYTWPKVFVDVPRIGDRVKARESGVCSHLKVHGVTHYSVFIEDKYGKETADGIPGNWEPRVEIELNK